ncbi:hypothetical protein [uncultured Methylovirgula sp.]|uniref:hypothetical protein n=1 Tax=uncultured Methylovirgula sp. TaxID=1285960 RepID=UPI0026306219|nr:hypothetical protein [uncultured Methylovirgula sp.]
MQAIARCFMAGAFIAGAVMPASAHFHHRVPHCWTAGPGLILKMSHYQQPDGTYDSLGDFVRDVNGTPCGVDCPAPSRVIFASPPPVYCD